MALATTFLPVPVSPVISTDASWPADNLTSSATSRNPPSAPMSMYSLLSCRFLKVWMRSTRSSSWVRMTFSTTIPSSSISIGLAR